MRVKVHPDTCVLRTRRIIFTLIIISKQKTNVVGYTFCSNASQTKYCVLKDAKQQPISPFANQYSVCIISDTKQSHKNGMHNMCVCVCAGV